MCHTLPSARLMNWGICLQRAAALYLGGFLSSTEMVLVVTQIQCCGPSGEDRFFYDFTSLLELSRHDTMTLILFPFLTCILEPILFFLFVWLYSVGIISVWAGRRPFPAPLLNSLVALLSMTPSFLSV